MRNYKFLYNKYKKENSEVLRLDTGERITLSNDNPDYQEYLAWLAEGNEPLPADEPEQKLKE